MLLLFLVPVNQSEVRRTLHVLSSLGFGEVADPEGVKGGKSSLSGLMVLSKSKNSDEFFSCFRFVEVEDPDGVKGG